MNERVDIRGLFGCLDGLSGEETTTTFMPQKGPALELGLRERIIGVLAAVIRVLVMVAMLHYMVAPVA